MVNTRLGTLREEDQFQCRCSCLPLLGSSLHVHACSISNRVTAGVLAATVPQSKALASPSVGGLRHAGCCAAARPHVAFLGPPPWPVSSGARFQELAQHTPGSLLDSGSLLLSLLAAQVLLAEPEGSFPQQALEKIERLNSFRPFFLNPSPSTRCHFV